jgi:RimJ/RimL family protein N-acetyltransferase/anti-anti-sigma regulatory factor
MIERWGAPRGAPAQQSSLPRGRSIDLAIGRREGGAMEAARNATAAMRRIFGRPRPDGNLVPVDRATIHAGFTLTAGSARALCDQVRTTLARGVHALRIDLRGTRYVDAVGLAALLQSRRRAERLGVPCTLEVGPDLYRVIVDAKLVEELGVARPGRSTARPAGGGDPDPGGGVIGASKRLALRLPTREDMGRFKEWAENPLVEQMVGSELLYRCRHFAEDDPDLVAAILYDPRGLTVLVEPLPAGRQPVGFVRLYGIELVSGLCFVETMVAAAKGLGIAASRLLLSYGQDVLNVRRVEAKAYGYNLLSINALRRNGFQQEGVLRGARLLDDRAWDILVFSMLESELARQRSRESFPYFGFWSDQPCSSTS